MTPSYPELRKGTPMSLILCVMVALAAITSSPTPPPKEFVTNVIEHCRPVIIPEFIGCEAGPLPSEDETDYAGWTSSHGLQTGP